MLSHDRMKSKRLLIMILLAAVLVRLPVAVYMGDQVTVLPGIHDQVSYDALAGSLLAGRGYIFTAKWYPFTPANTPIAQWSRNRASEARWQLRPILIMAIKTEVEVIH